MAYVIVIDVTDTEGRPDMSDAYYPHWSDFPADEWIWPNFSPQEIACKATGALKVHRLSMDRLQALRTTLGKPMIIRSAFRTPEHNRAVGGAPKSQHLLGRAFDVAMANHEPHAFEAQARVHGFRGIGVYPRPKHDFIHIDTRETPARWTVGGEFESRAQSFGDLPPARPERLAVRDAGAVAAGGIVTESAISGVTDGQVEQIKAVAPLLPDNWQAYLYGGIAALALGMALWRVFRTGDTGRDV